MRPDTMFPPASPPEARRYEIRVYGPQNAPAVVRERDCLPADMLAEVSAEVAAGRECMVRHVRPGQQFACWTEAAPHEHTTYVRPERVRLIGEAAYRQELLAALSR